MLMTFACPKCNNTLQAEDTWAGRQTQCPYCKNNITIPNFASPLGTKAEMNSRGNEVFSKKATDFFSKALGTEAPVDFSLSNFMNQIGRHHTWDEIEEFFAVGTRNTTPSLSQVSYSWPAPWLFIRVLAFFVISFLIVIWRLDDLGTAAPMLLLFLGIVGIPFASLTFFMELNPLKNISIAQIGKVVLAGGFLSIMLTLIAIKFFPSYRTAPAYWAGPFEEITKGCIILLFVFNLRYRYKANGLLIGAAVGVGFAIIETGGYVVKNSNVLGGDVGMETMIRRAICAPLGHVLYSSLVGYGIWISRKATGEFDFSYLTKGQTLRPVLLGIALHMFWNSPLLNSEYIVKMAIVAIVGYGAVIILLNSCIREIRMLQQSTMARQ